ncbi:hypothetical protein ES703_119196 [subsurface metagenome]
MNKIKITNDEIKEYVGAESYEFPKYASQIMNWANQISQGTRPKVVGQMSELIQEFDGRSIREWEEWYLQKHPKAIEEAAGKVYSMVENFKDVIQGIDKDMVREWIRDLVILKTYTGLKFQEAILKKLSNELGRDYRIASPVEESKGIDGYIGEKPVSIKPHTYKSQSLTLSEEIDVSIIYYEKKKTGLVVEYNV